MGIERTREAFGAFAGDRCVGILLQETASPGLCLSGLMSAAFLLPTLPEADPDGAPVGAGVGAVRGQQRRVAAALDDLPVIEDDDY